MTARLDEIIRFSRDDIEASYQAIFDDLTQLEIGNENDRKKNAEFMVYSSGIMLLRTRGWATKDESAAKDRRIAELEAQLAAAKEGE